MKLPVHKLLVSRNAISQLDQSTANTKLPCSVYPCFSACVSQCVITRQGELIVAGGGDLLDYSSVDLLFFNLPSSSLREEGAHFQFLYGDFDPFKDESQGPLLVQA